MILSNGDILAPLLAGRAMLGRPIARWRAKNGANAPRSISKKGDGGLMLAYVIADAVK